MSKSKIILHSDLNHFYANCEIFANPELSNKPVVVCGDAEQRHGIILTKNPIAKAFGIKTGEAIWEAKQKCPQLVTVSANYSLYLKTSELVREIYADYSDRVESFGIDECWIDVTDSTTLFGKGRTIADEIRDRIRNEIGITASVGVSYNKIFAKLGSDMEKPDATTIIREDNYKDVAWRLPVSDLLYVGRATTKKLRLLRIYTIGDLAKADTKLLHDHLGVMGIVIHRFANGWDHTQVTKKGSESYVKSVGNSITAPRDLETLQDVTAILYMLSDSVAARLRKHKLKCQGVQISIRGNDLQSCDRQAPLISPSYITNEIAQKAVDIFHTKYHFVKPVRSIGVRAINLVAENTLVQTNLFQNEDERRKQEELDKTLDRIRDRYGYRAIRKGILLEDRELTNANPIDEHIIHPVSLFKDGKIT